MTSCPFGQIAAAAPRGAIFSASVILPFARKMNPSTRSNILSTPEPGSNREMLLDQASFSLVLGGPLFQLLRRAHLSDDALGLLRRRVVVIALFAWLPLLVLAALDGDLLSKRLAVPFLFDLETHIRFLVVVPLLIIAELVAHQRLLSIVRTFLERKLVPEESLPRFDHAIRSAFRLRNSVLAEALVLAVVYTIGALFWRRYMSLHVETWYATSSAAGAKLSPAGIWYAYLSLPLFQFLMIRWYFRLFIWARFLWQVSRIGLRLIPPHPDAFGGLGFLSNTVYAFTVLLVAHGVLLAAQIGNRIFFLGEPLSAFKAEIAACLLFLLCLVSVPLLVFVPQLAQAKRTGLHDYGALAERYLCEFDHKWLRTRRDEPLVGSADIQSLADMGGSFEMVRAMRLVPVTRDAVVRLTAAVLAPVVPLLLTVMPVEELVKKLVGLLF